MNFPSGSDTIDPEDAKTEFRLHLETQTVYSTTVKVPSSPVCATT